MTFGDCLGCLLSNLMTSINRLSKAINVDSSLVNRWIHGKRIPPYNTSYIEDISEYLSKNIHNTFQRKSIEELYLNVCGEGELEINIKEKIKEVLLESQGFSIECREKEKWEHKEFLGQREVVLDSLGSDQFHYGKPDYLHDGDNLTNNFLQSVNLSNEDKIIFGSDNLLTASITLLEATANIKCRNNSTIYMTYIHDLNMDNIPNESLIRIRNALLKIMHNEWNVLFLLKLNYNISRTIKLIEFVKPLIVTGKFNLYYIKKYDSFSLGKEIMIVPDVGALSCFSTKFHSEINCAFFFKNKAAIDIFKDHLNVLIANSAAPLIKYCPKENVIDYYYSLVEKEENIGNRFLCKHFFNVLTLPEDLYKRILKRMGHSNDEMQKSLEFYKRRLNAFLINIENYEYKDIYFMDSIKQLFIHQQFYFLSYKGIEQVALEVEDIIESLQNIIHLLKKYNNFSIAFACLNKECTERNDFFYCLVKERQAVFLEVFNPPNYIPKMHLSIEEPMVVRAFDEYFNEIWDQISPINKEKTEVIRWLEKQISILANKLEEKQ